MFFNNCSLLLTPKPVNSLKAFLPFLIRGVASAIAFPNAVV